MNNNCDLDNGVYNKFVNQSSEESGDEDEDHHSDEEAITTQRSDARRLISK